MLNFSELAEKIYGKSATGGDGNSAAQTAPSSPGPGVAASPTPEKAMDVAAPPMPDPRPDGVGPKLSELPFVKEGEQSAKWWADRYVETGHPAYAVGGLLASLWTPETADDTLATLTTAAGLGRYEARPFWRYVGPNAGPEGKWLTRGLGWKAPYGEDFARARDALQIPNEVTGVVKVKPSMGEPVRGPRFSLVEKDYGFGGGSEYYRGWKWPVNRPKPIE